MAKWQIALALGVAAVALHVFGLLRQIRHYRNVFTELATRWRGARIGTGSAGAAMAIVVADERGVVQAARLRIGNGTFARFLPRDDFVGLSLADLQARAAASGGDAAEALGQAVEMVKLNAD